MRGVLSHRQGLDRGTDRDGTRGAGGLRGNVSDVLCRGVGFLVHHHDVSLLGRAAAAKVRAHYDATREEHEADDNGGQYA